MRVIMLITAGAALLGAAAAADEKKAAKGTLPEGIFKVWMHSREEDKGGVKVYRPRDFKFPPARGRAGFEMKKDGEFVELAIAAADGTEKIKGKWKLVGKAKVEVSFPGTERKGKTFEVVSCDGKVLKIK